MTSATTGSLRPLCFVLMPFGQKPDATGALVNFDAVYQELIRPAIEEAGFEPIRADEEMTGGIIHKPMFERLVLCEYAVADLTTANANVFYELGVRHAIRPWSTVLMFAAGGRLPFDVAPLRAMPYPLDGGKPADIERTRSALVKQLETARDRAKDSPVFQLLEWTTVPDVAHMKTDVFRERAEYSAQCKAELAAARRAEDGSGDQLRAIEKSLGPLRDTEAGVVIDLFLSYRALKAWDEMVGLVGRMDAALRDTVMVQEQLALALNRLGKRDEAEQVLLTLIERRGPSSETYGILGRVYKDRWQDAKKANQASRARGLLDKAIDAYLRGFEADQRDAYPGVNVVTLMELRDPPDSRRFKLMPVVRYAVERKMARGSPDYWDYATLLELAVLAKDEGEAMSSLDSALAGVSEPMQPESTAGNLRLIREARTQRGEALPWQEAVEEELNRAAGQAVAAR